MSKIIVKNDVQGLSDEEAVGYILKVVQIGKISKGTYGDQYCHLVALGEYGRIQVTCETRESGTYTFRLYDQPQRNTLFDKGDKDVN